MQAGVRCPGSPEAAISRDPAPRLKAIDALRGLVIVLMALDHARDFFHAGAMTFSPTDLARTTPLLFATRWVTHLCAPLFSLLAGVGAWLRLQRPGETRASLSRYLVSRGLWLIVLELVVMRVAMNFSLSMAYPPLLLVLWVLGLSMLILAALVWLPLSVVLAGSLVVIVGHNLLDPIRAADLGQFAGVWRVLHEPGVLPVGGIVAVVGYPLVPWCAVMAAGYGLGPLFGALADVRQRRLVTMGIACCVAFLGLRLMNGYGDPAPWSVQPSAVLTVLSFLNTTKYPPSLAFLLMTLGPGLLLLAWMDRRAWPAGQPLVVFGRVPLFFFVSHFFVLHGLAAVAALATYGRAAAAFLWMPLPSMGGPAAAFPPGFGYPLWGCTPRGWPCWCCCGRLAADWPPGDWRERGRARVAGSLRVRSAEDREQGGERLQLLGVQRAHVLFQERRNDFIDGGQRLESLRRDRRADIPPILAATRARDEAGLLEAVEQAGDVGDAPHHTLPDFAAAEPLLAGATQDPQHVVLGRGDARGLQQGLDRVFQQGGGALQADEGFFVWRLERPRLLEFLLQVSRHVATRYV